MNKKKTGKSKAAKSMRDLPGKTLSAKTTKAIKGGSKNKGQNPSENISLPYVKVQTDYSSR